MLYALALLGFLGYASAQFPTAICDMTDADVLVNMGENYWNYAVLTISDSLDDAVWTTFAPNTCNPMDINGAAGYIMMTCDGNEDYYRVDFYQPGDDACGTSIGWDYWNASDIPYGLGRGSHAPMDWYCNGTQEWADVWIDADNANCQTPALFHIATGPLLVSSEFTVMNSGCRNDMFQWQFYNIMGVNDFDICYGYTATDECGTFIAADHPANANGIPIYAMLADGGCSEYPPTPSPTMSGGDDDSAMLYSVSLSFAAVVLAFLNM